VTSREAAVEGLRERKKRETRMALSLAAVRLAVQRGWDHVTVEEIAAAANVSERTFRNYFSSKAEAIASRHLDRTLQIAEDLRERPAGEPLWDAISHAVLPQYPSGGVGTGDRGWQDAMRVMLAEPALRAEILRIGPAAQEELARAIAERTGTDARDDLYPKLVAAAVGAATAAAVEHCLRAQPPVTIGPVLAGALHQLARGLDAP
jgi:AcrR family transcriptional regulator